jgi:UDP-glucuronate decarboxylase
MAIGDGRVVSSFITQAIRGQPLTIFGEGQQTRSFCYVDDLIDGLMAMVRPASIDGPINLGNPGEFTVAELAEAVAALVGGELVIKKAPLPADDPRQRKPDITRAREILGFDPKIDLRTGLALTLKDFRRRLASDGGGGRA